ncbi:hypothetical protein [Mesorhizobium sp. M8A.F.Ca.ET.021.01.1.1]|uniref:hypothetical protein n=1 Tax=Mesorhizobium sp. M8A.F.Ca.ET.021.01.1.1 TaxID=2496757 RepID=UPI000FCB5C12|nr:hypothetical protein [Mesorhizobium sp. M8A.F.Ca.ET.021.01.1.1]RUW55824.1 hypothetical protein EOA36_07110 [Mesorhizobium sp. M8A.F.Ca.ET.021.01.1.1]
MADEPLSLEIIEKRRAWAQPVLDAHKARTANMEKAAIECGNLALKALLLVNGGACVALLGFLSSTFNAATDPTVPQTILARLAGIVLDNGVAAERARLIMDVTGALSWFAWGTAAAVSGSALAYLTNSVYSRALTFQQTKYDWPYVEQTPKSEREWARAAMLNWVAVATGVAALCCFAGGILSVQHIY